MIKEQPDLRVADAISDRENAIAKILKLKPDIFLIDLGLRTKNSIEVVKAVRKSASGSKIIVMDLLPAQSDILDFVKAGASGFILKDAMIQDFLKTIRSVAEGGKVLPPNMAGSLFTEIINTAINGSQKIDFRHAVQMTKRERQIIEIIADGLTNKEIGNILHLSPYTVKSHVHNILEKMALHTRL
ncbi:MAG: response regulator transcription factor [Ignavibacteria bacterium]|nr:response regulator transcription factor [Ignavibacteria bacterium]